MTIDQARRRKLAARWHRRFAVFISLWLVVLAASGMLINHAHDLGLDHRPLSASLQQLMYGIESSGENFCVTVTVAEIDCAGVFASLPLPMGELLLAQDNLLLLDDNGQLLEKLAVSQLGLGQLQAGFSEGSDIYLRDAHKTILTDAELMDREILDTETAEALKGGNWQVRNETTTAITWERLLLDLHAARFLGPLAKVFNDLMAVLILVLAASGARLYWIKRKANGNGLTERD